MFTFPSFKCVFVIIIVLLFLSVLGIPLAIVMIVDRCKAMKVHHHKSLHHYCGHLWYHSTNYGDFTFICTSYISQSKDSSDKNFADRIKLQYVDLIQGIPYSCILSWCALTWSCLCMCYDIEKCMKTKNKSRTVPDGRYTCICKYTVGTGTYHPEKKKQRKKNNILLVNSPSYFVWWILCVKCLPFTDFLFLANIPNATQTHSIKGRSRQTTQLCGGGKFAFNFKHVHRQTSSNSMTVVIVSSDE